MNEQLQEAEKREVAAMATAGGEEPERDPDHASRAKRRRLAAFFVESDSSAAAAAAAAATSSVGEDGSGSGSAGGGKEAPEVIVAIRKGNIVGTAFHPELTNDSRWHEYFVRIVKEAVNASTGKEREGKGESPAAAPAAASATAVS